MSEHEAEPNQNEDELNRPEDLRPHSFNQSLAHYEGNYILYYIIKLTDLAKILLISHIFGRMLNFEN